VSPFLPRFSQWVMATDFMSMDAYLTRFISRKVKCPVRRESLVCPAGGNPA